MSGPRYAIYYAPTPDHPLWARASAWLGRDAYSGAALTRPAFPELADLDLDALTEDPRGYGFHATMRAPFELSGGEHDLLGLAEAFASRQRAFEAPLAPQALGHFLAFRPTGDASAIQALHEAALNSFEPVRAPLSDFDLARRRKSALTPAQDTCLVRWGYPYVREFFRFHMTLTSRIADDAVRARVLAALQAHFADLAGPHRFDGIAVFKQDDRAAPFVILRRFPFGG